MAQVKAKRMKETLTLPEVREVAFGSFLIGYAKGGNDPLRPMTKDELIANLRWQFDEEWDALIDKAASTATEGTDK